MRLSTAEAIVTVCQYLTILSTRFLMFPASNWRKEMAVPLVVPLVVEHSQYTYSMLEGGQFVQHAPQGPDVTAEGWCHIRPSLSHSHAECSNTHSPLVIVWPVLTDLWREVVWSPNTCPCQLHSAAGSEGQRLTVPCWCLVRTKHLPMKTTSTT